jgi:hypothetical protein
MMLTRQQLLACPFVILLPEHYREDGTCLCNDPKHREVMKTWGYTDENFIAAGLIEGVEP